MTEKKIPDAAAAREAARTQTGKFGTQPRSEADLDLDVVRSALPPGPEADFHQFTYAALCSFDDRRDDPAFFDDPDTHGARVRLSVLASAFADRDKAIRDAAIPDVLALYDVPGGILEGRTAELQAAVDENRYGYPSGFRFVDTSRWCGRRTGLREEHRTVLAALIENHLRTTDPTSFGDARELNIHPDQYQPEEMTAEELAEVHRRLTVTRNFSAENTDKMIDKVRKAPLGTSLRVVHFRDGQASQLTEQPSGVRVQKLEPALILAGTRPARCGSPAQADGFWKLRKEPLADFEGVKVAGPLLARSGGDSPASFGLHHHYLRALRAFVTEMPGSSRRSPVELGRVGVQVDHRCRGGVGDFELLGEDHLVGRAVLHTPVGRAGVDPSAPARPLRK